MSGLFDTEVSQWLQTDDEFRKRIAAVKSKVDYLSLQLYNTYKVTSGAHHPIFRKRLANWVESAETESERKSLFLMFEDICYIGKNELAAGVDTGFHLCVKNWICEVNNISIFDPKAEQKINSALEKTLFTAITDSFPLRDFLLTNGMDGHSDRFNWSQGLKTWDKDKFMTKFLKDNTHIVLFEDFVGSGSQMEDAVVKACHELPSNIKILFCPILICPRGDERALYLCTQFSNLTYSPVLKINESSFITENKTSFEKDSFAEFRGTILSTFSKVAGTDGSWPKKTGPFGYRDTGAFIVKFDNCPDNSLPLIHHSSDKGWNAIFPRVDREA